MSEFPTTHETFLFEWSNRRYVWQSKMQVMKEEWVLIETPARCMASSLGNIKNSEGKVVKLYDKVSGDKSSYLNVRLITENKELKFFRVGRLIATAFIPNPMNLPCVNHKDGDKRNNSVSNLEWCTYSQNMQHAYNMGLKLPTNGRRVKATNLTTGEVFEFVSAWEASRFTGGQPPNIYSCCNHKRKSHKGFSFTFI